MKNESNDVPDHLSPSPSPIAFSGKIPRRDFLSTSLKAGAMLPFSGAFFSGTPLFAQEKRRGGTIRVGSTGGSSTDSLDPATFLAQVAVTFGKSWGELLLEVAEDGGVRKRLVEEYGASKDAKVWNFKLRRGILFHDGKELRAEDAVQTLSRHAGEGSKSGAQGILKSFSSIRAKGEYEFEIESEVPNADLPYLLTDYHLIVQPGGGVERPDAGIGTGAYRVAVNEPGVRLVGERFEEFWDADNRGFADSVEIYPISDNTARVSALQSGKVDIVNRIEPKLVDLVRRIPGIDVKAVQGRGHYLFVMHCNTPPFDDPDLRLALKYAVDREEMVKTILNGYGTVGNDFPINSAYSLFSDDVEPRRFDPEKAKFHFKKSKHRGPIVLRSSDAAFAGAMDAAQLYQASAAKAGIDVEIRREPSDGYWSNVWNAKPFCASFWVGRPTQDLMYSTAYLSSASWNDTRFFNDEFDATLLRAKGELDETKRKAMYRRLALMVRDEGGAVIPMFNNFIDASSQRVGGYDPHPNADLMDNLCMVKTWKKA